jgi:pyrimidine-specific ribonucleoside hydrolase
MKTPLIVILISAFASLSHHKAICQQPPITVIFDSDMGPDYDDVGALAMLHAMADKKEAEVLATIASTRYNGVATIFDILNTYFGRPGLPVGVPKGKALELKDFQHWTDTLIARYPYSIKRNDDAVDAIALYRSILAAQPDHSVTIITVGFLTNIAALLQSPPDKYAALTGTALVEKKVLRLVSMAGAFPSGHEFNVRMDAASAAYAFTHFPRPILFSGVEIGFPIKTGLQLINNADISSSPVKDVYRMCMAMTKEDVSGRSSWDQTAVLVAIRGHETWYDVQEGRIVLDAEGRNEWDKNGKGHFYLVEKNPRSVVANAIEELMMHQPLGKR